MRFLISVIAQGDQPATREEMVAIDAFNDAMAAKGQRIMAVGMEHPSTAAVYDNRQGQGEVTPGTYVVCAVSGTKIPLEALRYWSVDLQEAYVSPQAKLERLGVNVKL